MTKLYRPVGSKTLWPIGSVFFTATKVNPSTWFGGTWEQLYGGYLYLCQTGAEKTSYVGLHTQSGGATATGSTTLTAAQSGLQSHGHDLYYSTSSSGYASGSVIAARSSASNTKQWNGSLLFYTWVQNNSAKNATEGHTHPMSTHTHNLATVGFFAWKRTA